MKKDMTTAFIFLGMCVPFVALTIWATVNAAQKDFGSMGQKVLWMAIAAIPFVGFIVYLIFGFRKGRSVE
jgi:hypothetical protein